MHASPRAAALRTEIIKVCVPAKGEEHAGKLAVEWSTEEPFMEMTLAIGVHTPPSARPPPWLAFC